MSNRESEVPVLKYVVWSCVTVLLLTLVFLGGYPQYFVYSKTLNGKAHMKEAEFSRQIIRIEAEAKKEAATLLADAEVERAKGVAKANAIIGESLKGNESYLHYLWIQGLSGAARDIVYVPTEANLPILEAGRFGQLKTDMPNVEK